MEFHLVRVDPFSEGEKCGLSVLEQCKKTVTLVLATL